MLTATVKRFGNGPELVQPVGAQRTLLQDACPLTRNASHEHLISRDALPVIARTFGRRLVQSSKKNLLLIVTFLAAVLLTDCSACKNAKVS